jgi:menaquinone-dependent protoporphyrinogen oxidase
MRVLLVYGTTEGQTAKVMRAVAARLTALGHQATTIDASEVPEGLDPGRFDAAILAASLHAGHFQSSVTHFARHHQAALAALPTAFLPVSLAAAGEDPEDRKGLDKAVATFLDRADWHPGTVHPVAGAFRFTEYDFFKRWIMRQIAAKKGAPTDTSRDYEYTDWADLDRFVDGFAAGAAAK